MVEVDYAANMRRSLDRVKHAAAHLKNFFDADTKVRNLTADRITAYQAARLKHPEREGEPRAASPSTVNYELAVLRRAFRLGARAGKVAARPEIQMLHVENARKGFFEPEQHRAVVNHLPDYLKPVASVAYVTGWRTRSELLTRQWRHVDFANGWPKLDPGESKNGDGREFPFMRTAGESKTSAALGRRRARLRVYRDGWSMIFAATAVRNLERAGVPRSAAMKLTGHKTEAVYRRYAITDSAMLQEAAVKLTVLHASEANSPSTAKVRDLSAKADGSPLQ
jgi:integrase